MKNIFLILSIFITGFISANTISTKIETKNSVKFTKTLHLIKIGNIVNGPDRSYWGMGGYDTECCGTCFTYGHYQEWDLGNGQFVQSFTPASQATLATMTANIPPCTGAGSYLG